MSWMFLHLLTLRVKTAEGQYAIPFKAKYLKLTDNSVQSGDVLSSLVMRVAQD